MAHSLTASHRVLKLPPSNHGQNGNNSNGQFAAGDAVTFRDRHGHNFSGTICGPGKKSGNYRVKATFLPMQRLREKIAKLKASLKTNNTELTRWELKYAQETLRYNCSRRADGGMPMVAYFNLPAERLQRIIERPPKPKKREPRINGVLSCFRARFGNDPLLLRDKLRSAGLACTSERCAMDASVPDVRHKHHFRMKPFELLPATVEDVEQFDKHNLRFQLRAITHYLPKDDPTFNGIRGHLAACEKLLQGVEDLKFILCFEDTLKKVSSLVVKWEQLQCEIRQNLSEQVFKQSDWFTRFGDEAQNLTRDIALWLKSASYLSGDETMLVWAAKEADDFQNQLADFSRVMFKPWTIKRLGNSVHTFC